MTDAFSNAKQHLRDTVSCFVCRLLSKARAAEPETDSSVSVSEGTPQRSNSAIGR